MSVSLTEPRHVVERLARAATTEVCLSQGQRAYLQVRYLFDRVLAGALLLLALPLFVVIALAVVIDSRGGVLFRQRRVGQVGRLFHMYKFRSMTAETPPYNEKLAHHDPRITRVGRVIRLTGLDELPQLINVLRGEMALIGPRPEMQFIVDLLDPWQRQREVVKPGITGWWQVHHRDNVPLRHNIDRDLDYLARVGPRIDLQIVLLTLRVIVLGAIASCSRGSAPDRGTGANESTGYQEKSHAGAGTDPPHSDYDRLQA